MNILILAHGYFPYGGAYASRLLNMCRLIHASSNNAHVITWFKNRDKKREPSKEICTFDHISDSHSRFDNYILPFKLIKRAYEYASNNTVNCIISSRMPIGFNSLLRLSKKLNIPLLLEQCEWIDSSNFKGGKYQPLYFLGERNMIYNYKKSDGIIAISRLLYDHYSTQGVNVIRMPTILDVKEMDYEVELRNEPTEISYFGSPGVSKENLKNVIRAIAIINEQEKRIHLNIYGPNRESVLRNIGYDEVLLQTANDYITIQPNVPQSEMPCYIRASDYTFFARPNRRSSNAGFPTKFAESMASGTPVITNLTGDIELYLKDKVNGRVLRDTTVDSIHATLLEIIEETQETRKCMRINARRTAEKCFDYRVYTEEFCKFITSLVEKRLKK